MKNACNGDIRYATTSTVQGGLSDVLSALKSNIMRALNVATLAEVQKVDEKSGIVTVKPFPLIDGEQDKNVDCYACLMPKTVNESIEWVGIESSLSMHDIVIVAFLNRDSEQSYRQTKKSMKRTALNENSDLHSDKYGFIIGICWKHIEKEESK